MSSKGSNKSVNSGLRNSFHILSTLEDPVLTSKKNKVAEAPAVAAAQVKEVKKETAARPAAPKVEAAAAKNGNQKQKEAKKAVQQSAKKAEALPVRPANTTSNPGAMIKMLIFALLMLVMPIGAYYWSVNQAGLDLGEIKSAMIAVLVVNALLFVYILMAYFEDAKLKKKNQ